MQEMLGNAKSWDMERIRGRARDKAIKVGRGLGRQGLCCLISGSNLQATRFQKILAGSDRIHFSLRKKKKNHPHLKFTDHTDVNSNFQASRFLGRRDSCSPGLPSPI